MWLCGLYFKFMGGAIMTINKNKLTENTGFNFESMEDLVCYISCSIEWLTTHNKNYTKEQYNRMCDLRDILDCIDI